MSLKGKRPCAQKVWPWISCGPKVAPKALPNHAPQTCPTWLPHICAQIQAPSTQKLRPKALPKIRARSAQNLCPKFLPTRWPAQGLPRVPREGCQLEAHKLQFLTSKLSSFWGGLSGPGPPEDIFLDPLLHPHYGPPEVGHKRIW